MERGILYLIATPIGNLEDITYRAVRILSEVDLIACEDTRKSGILLKHLDISKPLLSYHNYNEKKVSDKIIQRILDGENVAVISDAGTPSISDPGYIIVREAVLNNIDVIPIPGACALIIALSASGLPMDAFTFSGFLSPKSGKRKTVLESLRDRRETLVFYESPHRINKLLIEVRDLLGNRQIALCRELTKKFEEIIRGNVEDVIEQIAERKLKGEITLVVEGLLRKAVKKQ